MCKAQSPSSPRNNAGNGRNSNNNNNNNNNRTRSRNERKERRQSDEDSRSSDDSRSPPKRSNKRSRGGKHRPSKGGNQQKRNNKAPSNSPPHDAPMGKADIYFALDCEMVGVGMGGQDSALARVSIVNWDNRVVLDTFVQVPVPVSDYRTFVSGVRPEDIEGEHARPFEEVQVMVRAILTGKILIGHALENDLKALGISHPWSDVRDTATYAPYMREVEGDAGEGPTRRPKRLRELVSEKLGREIQMEGQAHSSVEDAIAAMDLYKASRPEWEQAMMKMVNEATEIQKNHEAAMMAAVAAPAPMYNKSPSSPSSPSSSSQGSGGRPRSPIPYAPLVPFSSAPHPAAQTGAYMRAPAAAHHHYHHHRPTDMYFQGRRHVATPAAQIATAQ